MILCATYTDIGGRPYNEDWIGVKKIDENHLCAVLADGLGGHGGGDIASKEAADRILEGYNGMMTPAALCELIQAAHRRIVSLQTPVCRMKTTVVVLAAEAERVQWAHVGDSRLYHFKDKKLVFQTLDHSASQVAVMMGQIKPDEIRFHEDRSRLYRALGEEGAVSIDVRERELEKGTHAFLLCSDGFWEYVYEEEMERELRDAKSPQEWLERMRKLHLSRVEENHDNNSAVAVWITI